MEGTNTGFSYCLTKSSQIFIKNAGDQLNLTSFLKNVSVNVILTPFINIMSQLIESKPVRRSSEWKPATIIVKVFQFKSKITR